MTITRLLLGLLLLGSAPLFAQDAQPAPDAPPAQLEVAKEGRNATLRASFRELAAQVKSHVVVIEQGSRHLGDGNAAV